MQTNVHVGLTEFMLYQRTHTRARAHNNYMGLLLQRFPNFLGCGIPFTVSLNAEASSLGNA